MSRPILRFHYDPFLALRAAIRVRHGERLPTPQEVANTDPLWEGDVMTAQELIDFHKDYSKIPK